MMTLLLAFLHLSPEWLATMMATYHLSIFKSYSFILMGVILATAFLSLWLCEETTQLDLKCGLGFAWSRAQVVESSSFQSFMLLSPNDLFCFAYPTALCHTQFTNHDLKFKVPSLNTN